MHLTIRGQKDVWLSFLGFDMYSLFIRVFSELYSSGKKLVNHKLVWIDHQIPIRFHLDWNCGIEVSDAKRLKCSLNVAVVIVEWVEGPKQIYSITSLSQTYDHLSCVDLEGIIIFWKANTFYVQLSKKESVNQRFGIQFTMSVVFNIASKNYITDFFFFKVLKILCCFPRSFTTEWEHEYGAVKKSCNYYI